MRILDLVASTWPPEPRDILYSITAPCLSVVSGPYNGVLWIAATSELRVKTFMIGAEKPDWVEPGSSEHRCRIV